MKKTILTIFILALVLITACSSGQVAEENMEEITPPENVNTQPLEENTAQIIDENENVDLGDVI